MTHLAATAFGVLVAFGAWAQRSSFNGQVVVPADSTGHYRLLIGGHFHGESTNRSGYPASTLLASLDTINGLGAHLFLSTGDLFMDGGKDRPRYARALFSKLRIPLFNAPGNHDLNGAVGDEAVELGRIGIGRDLIFILNTEANDGSLSPEAVRHMAAVLEGEDPERPQRLFIISHRPIWAEDDEQYRDLFKDNTRSLTGNNFRKEVYPVLQRMAQQAEVYWISGSLGGDAPSSIFFQRHAPNITFIQCAIRDLPRDALLIADVLPDTVRWSALSLTGQQLLAPEAYDAAWWRAQRGKGAPFNWRLMPYLIRKTLLSPAFWWGAAAALLLGFLVRRMLARW
ncbi:MAG: metallophosphoesterase [Flavobacteriales bacterium]|jgi:hypothetical protein|nr:MAG: metallophosphoesterase [Flavobacteriales bacterium]